MQVEYHTEGKYLSITLKEGDSQRIEYLNMHVRFKGLLAVLKSAALPVCIVFVFLQMTTPNTLGYFHPTRQCLRSCEIQEERETFSLDHTAEPSNESFADKEYLQLTRVIPTRASNIFKSSCSSNVRLLRGFPRQTKGFLTLGLSTVPRENAFYLLDTLKSLLSKMTYSDRNESVIVIFLGSHDSIWVNKTLSLLDTAFAENMSSGLIQVVQPARSIYPNFTKISKRNYNDDLLRVHWRTKQNIDYAYLFAYCEQLSKYYIHIEDDVIAANGYMQEIRTFVDKVEKSKQTWFVIELSSLGFIGKLFRSRDLCTMKEYFLLFKDEKPCDLLINDLKGIKVQTRDIKSPKSLFQHFGLSSSLQGKIQKLTDRNFKDLAKVPIVLKKRQSLQNIIRSQRDKLLVYKQTKRR